MGWNGSGTFNRTDGTRTGTQVWQDADDAGVKIRADDHDTHDQDIVDGLENTVALDGQNTTTTDNSILRYDSGNTQFEGVSVGDNELVGRSGGDVTGVAISASEIVGRSASGNVRSLSAATARQTIGIGSAAPTNGQALFWSSAASKYTQQDSDAARSQLNLGTSSPTDGNVLWYASASSSYEQIDPSILSKMIGEVFAIQDDITGVNAPDNTNKVKFIKLTAGLTGGGQYNEGLLTNEMTSGSSPSKVATADIDYAESPMNGQTVRLINTEERFLRAGNAGTTQDWAIENITGSFTAPREDSLDHLIKNESGAFADGGDSGSGNKMSEAANANRREANFDASRVVNTATETRPRNLGITYYMRIA